MGQSNRVAERIETIEKEPKDGADLPQRPWGKQLRSESRERDGPSYAPLNTNDDVEEKAREPTVFEEIEKKEVKTQDAEDEIRSAAARIVVSLKAREEGICTAEESVYGAALVIPQIARSAGWPTSLTILSIRAYIFLFLNVFIQASLLTYVSREEYVKEPFGGEMYLCDFGSRAENDKGDRGRGPGGSEFSVARIHDFTTWQTRRYAERAFLALFPEKTKEINEHVDPGEFGLESYYCRIICCLVFMTTCLEDLLETISMVRLLWAVPNTPESWIQPSNDEVLDSNDINPYDELENVSLRLAGMSICWKVFAVVTITLPKFVLYKMTLTQGTCFLFETPGIEDVIVNSVALAFILGIDELMFETLMSTSVRSMIEFIEPYPLTRRARATVDETMTLDELMKEYEEEFNMWGIRDIAQLFPMKLLLVIGLSAYTIYNYYDRHCVLEKGEPIIGGWVSKPMYLPVNPHLTVLNAFFPQFYPMEMSEEPFWTMPPAK